MKSKKEKEINILKEKILKSQFIAIFSHENIDGDSLGAGLALGSILEKQGKNVKYFTPTPIPSKFSFLKEIEKYSYDFDFADYDLLIIVDTGCAQSQLSKFWSKNPSYWQSKYKIAIDHHAGNCNYADLNIVYPQYGSTCALLTDILNYLFIDYIDSKIATFLFLGHITDTNFCKRSDNLKDFQIATFLFEKGAAKNQIVENIYYNMTFEGIKYIGKLIENIKSKYNIAYNRYIESEFKKYNLDNQDASLLMDVMLKIKEKDIYVLLRFLENGIIKGSIRTKSKIANKIAQKLGGGGHAQAAGFKLDYNGGDKQKIVEQIIEKIYNIYISLINENS